MKRSTLLMVCCLTSLVLAPVFGSPAFGGARPPNETPPFGLAVQGDAPGTKLEGVIYVELTNFNGITQKYGTARVSMRLRKGSLIRIIFGDVSGSFDPSTKSQIQDAILSDPAGLGDEIKSALSLGFANLVLKAVDQEVDSKTQNGVSLPSLFYMADITIAVQ
jgi:hypothetical protein